MNSKSSSRKVINILIVAVLAAVVGAVIYAKNNNSADTQAEPAESTEQLTADADDNIGASESVNQSEPAAEEAPDNLPVLIDLGADKCIPCKMMAPILEELESEYADTFEVRFIDVWKNPDAAEGYNIRVIPTQIFYNAEGKELFRHEGFFSKEDILKTWEKHGVIKSGN